MTIPKETLMQMNWEAGMVVELHPAGQSLTVTSEQPRPRGKKSLSELLKGIDKDEIQQLNEAMGDVLNSPPVGKEIV
ncbi:antitoxin [Enterobacteriaceae bacterium]